MVNDPTLNSTATAKIGTDIAPGDDRFRLLVDSIKDYAVFLLSTEGRVVTWNAGARAIKGYTAEEIINQPISRFYSPEDAAAGKPQKLLAIAARDGRVEDEGWRYRKDGTAFWADVVITALRDTTTGELVGYAKVTRDLTERRAAEESLRASEERFRLLVESVEDYAIYMLDPEGRVSTWNAGAQRIKGYAASEIIGEHLSRFYTEEDLRAGKLENELETAARVGRFEDEGWRVRKDGTRFWANVVLTALRGARGELIGYAKVTRDLTERRALEEERIRLAQAQEAIRLRDDFLSIASHELKTPLTALQLQLQAVQEFLAGDPKLARKIERAERSTERLTNLIETLLDVSRISTGRFELAPSRFDLIEAVTDVVERMRPSAERADCELSLHVEGSVVGTWDRLRLEQVMTNLLGNAMKYAAGTAIDVSARGEGDRAILEFRDRGPGIPEEALARVFGRFERAASSRHYGGLGLGLYVAREIVAGHGGDIRATNLPEGGACLTVELPVGFFADSETGGVPEAAGEAK